MSIAAKKRKHASKMERKREIKRARREKYAALAGSSKKNKRQHKHVLPSATKHSHLMQECGNPGCKKCHAWLNTPKWKRAAA